MWNFNTIKGCGLFFEYYFERYYSIEISGDTLIGGTNYHKLVSPEQVFHSNGACNISGTWTAPGFYAGAIRQDIANKKVFYVDTMTYTEQLLYDFNLQVGDTVKGFYVSNNPCWDEIVGGLVVGIDSVMIGNSYRKRWNIGGCFNTPDIYFIEGIGSTYGLIDNFFLAGATDHPIHRLQCFTKMDSLLFPSSLSSCQFMECNSSFSLFQDYLTPHNWFALSNISGVPPFTYLWLWGDGSSDTTAYPSHTYDSAGYYSICVYITDNTGCTSFYCNNSSNLYVSENGIVTVNVTKSLPIGIDQVVEYNKELNLAPIPASSTLFIKNCTGKEEVFITNLTGKILLRTKLKHGQTQVDISNLDNGLYFLQTDNGKTKKFIVQH